MQNCKIKAFTIMRPLPPFCIFKEVGVINKELFAASMQVAHHCDCTSQAWQLCSCVCYEYMFLAQTWKVQLPTATSIALGCGARRKLTKVRMASLLLQVFSKDQRQRQSRED